MQNEQKDQHPAKQFFRYMGLLQLTGKKTEVKYVRVNFFSIILSLAKSGAADQQISRFVVSLLLVHLKITESLRSS